MAIFIDKDGNVVTYENQPEQERAMFPNLCDCQDLAAQIEILKNDIADLKEDIANKTDYIYDTAQGTIASFSDGADGAPIKSLVVSINPVQDLHGYDAPWPAGGGKNMLLLVDGTYAVGNTGATAVVANGSITITGNTTISGGRTTRLSDYFILKAGTYILSPIVSSPYIRGYLNKRSDNSSIGYTNGSPFTLTEDTEVYYGVGLEDGKTYNATIYPQVESGSTITSWTPHSNICPITGWTGAEISHSGADTSNPETLIITFPSEAGTVYGGTLDVTTGVLTVTSSYIASYNGETLPSTWISDRDVYASGTTPTIGAEVVYELDTPQTYQITPVEVSTLLGTNNIWADTGDVTLTYPCDLKLYIDKKIAEG